MKSETKDLISQFQEKKAIIEKKKKELSIHEDELKEIRQQLKAKDEAMMAEFDKRKIASKKAE